MNAGHVFLCSVLTLSAVRATAGEACLDNFASEGSFLSGRTYKTWAIVPGVRQGEAFSRAYAFTAEHGFTVSSADKEAGVISAAQSVSYGNGKTAPLSVTLQQRPDGVRVALTYGTSGGVSSPEDAIQRHFCLTIASVANGATKTNAP